MTQNEARKAILAAANRGRLSVDPYTRRSLQRAVHRVRERGLVKPGVLVSAGFRAHGPNQRVKR